MTDCGSRGSIATVNISFTRQCARVVSCDSLFYTSYPTQDPLIAAVSSQMNGARAMQQRAIERRSGKI